MKIVFVTYSYWPSDFGGELLISIERFQVLAKRGYQAIVLTSGVPGLARHEFQESIEIYRSPIVSSSRLGRAFRRIVFQWWAFFMLFKLKYDVMHLSGVGGIEPISSDLSMWFASWIAKKKHAGTVTVHSLADTAEEPFSLKGFLLKLRILYLDKMDAFVSVSPALYHAVSLVYPKTSRLIQNSIRDDLFVPLPISERISLRAENNVTDEEIIFTFLGTMCRRKGFDVLGQAFVELSAIYPNLRLWVIGPKSERENRNIRNNEFLEMMKPLQGMGDKVYFWGRIDDRQFIAKILAISDIFVFPTRKEGMPLAPMEAMSAGLPLIISRIPGVTDMANIHEKTGLYVQIGDVNSLKKAMELLIVDAGMRLSMGQAARKQIESQFGWEKHIQEWELLYSSLKKEKTNAEDWNSIR